MSGAAIIRASIESTLRALPAALDPEARTERAVRSLRLAGPVRIVAIGKAARPMAIGASTALGDRLLGGVVVAPTEEPLDRLEVHLGSHPLPDERSLSAGRAALETAASRGHDRLLVLLSGGGSAMAEVPKPPLTIDAFADLTDRLLRSGASIDELNVVRRHLSRLKHGGLSGRSRVPVTTLLLSDVVDAPPSTVASGPTLQDDSTPLDALAVLERRLGRPIPSAVHTALATPVPRWPNGEVRVVADRHTAFAETAHRLSAEGLGEATPVRLAGDAAAMARRMAAAAGLTVGTGETTVEVTGGGVGGRNQHGALAAAEVIRGTAAVFAAFGTDGVDGPTDAAGAVVDGETWNEMIARGIDPSDALARCDSHTALDAAGCLIRTGPTGTNVADVWVSYVPATT